MTGRVEGRSILITGAASGIGLATARRAAAEGARLALLDVDPAVGTLAAELSASGRDVTGLRCDITRDDEVERALGAAARTLDGLDAVLHCAGILEGAFQPVESLPPETFSRVLEVNVTGTFLVARHAVPHLRSPGGALVCLASWAGVRGPSSSLAYASSKSAVAGFCATLERDLAPRGIRVNVVCPGSIDTPMKRRNLEDAARARGEDPDTGLTGARLGDPDGVARVLVFLASPEADYIVGTLCTR